MTGLPTLDLNELATGNIPALTPAMGAALAEAGGVCLESQGHSSGATLIVQGYQDGSYSLSWTPASEQARNRAYNEQERATEMGAAGIAILLAQRVTGYLALEPSRRGTGLDYWLGELSGGVIKYQAGLEVSGIRRGGAGYIRTRMREKLRQASQSGRQQWETYAIVVEFGRPLVEIHKNEL